VLVCDPAPGSGATWAAAGMLAPVTELAWAEAPLLELNLAAAQAYPRFAAEVSDAAGAAVGYLACGTLQVAWDAADLTGLRDLHAFGRAHGLRSELLTGRELREREPGLAAGLPGGRFAPDDHQVDNRLLYQAVTVAAGRSGVRVRPGRVRTVAPGRPAAIVLDDGERIETDLVLVAAGAASGELLRASGLSTAPPVRPVKGQTLRVRPRGTLIRHVVRAVVRRTPVYLVPRAAAAEIVIGASEEEAGFDSRPRLGAVHDLLRDAVAVLPELAEAEWLEVSTGLRPGSPDNAPIVGWLPDTDGVLVATGHYRHGVLLADVTARAVAALATGQPTDPLLAACGPQRFGLASLSPAGAS
jgi:glycine oxidase